MKSKMATVKPLKHKYFENEAKMHFTCALTVLAGLGTFKLSSKDFDRIFFAQASDF